MSTTSLVGRWTRALPSAAVLLALAALMLALTPAPARAHALDPSLLQLTETGSGEVEILWRTPVATLPGLDPIEPILPCPRVQDADDGIELAEGGRAIIRRWRIDCSETAAGTERAAGLGGTTISAAGLSVRGGEVLLRWVDPDGNVEQRVLDARRPEVVLPTAPSAGSVVADYTILGVEHILGGFDHLAFVVGLMLLVRGRKKLVLTLTSFTLGHSVTLALVVLGFVSPPSALVEWAIAGSILVLAVELARPKLAGREGTESWLSKRPWSMAAAFGLLHGCGFAGALREIGLPAAEVPLALATFNVGIELGQLAFVAVLWTLAWMARSLSAKTAGWLDDPRSAEPSPEIRHGAWALRAERCAVYALGCLAAYWTLSRIPFVD